METTDERFRCPGCGHMTRAGRDFLCSACWPQLPAETQARLQFVGDGLGLERLRALLEACRAGTPLKEIRIA